MVTAGQDITALQVIVLQRMRTGRHAPQTINVYLETVMQTLQARQNTAMQPQQAV